MCYSALCGLYYAVKDFFLLTIYLTYRIYRFFLWDIWEWTFKISSKPWFRKARDWILDHTSFLNEYDDEEFEDADYEVIEDEEEECVEEDDLHFCQLFKVGEEMTLLVDHVEMCPDETAFIRVADDEGFTPLYKRKVRRDSDGMRFIQFNGQHFYLKDEKTQPVINHDT